MTPPIVLAGKLRRPDAAGMVRSRLVAPLLAGPPGGLDLIIAPPGSGKTTLMARIAAESRIPIAWYRVTADDSSEAAVTAHLGTSMRSALGIQTAADTGMDSLLAVLEDQPDVEALVVIDDLHEIADTPAEAAIGRFIELRPTALRMLVGSRRQPGINIPRLRVSGLLREITSDDLRFRTWEVEELFTGFFREPLLPEAAAALTRRTGGWAAGLQLFHLATAGRSSAERAQAVTDLGGRSKLVRSYLARNVLDTIGEERRLFLLRTCTLGVLNAALCDELLETTGSARILDELEQRQLFTSSADDGQTFRYHEVLRTHLELALVEEGGAAGARSWYARAAALLERAGHLHEAARAFAAAEDWSAVARLVEQDRPQSGGTGANLLLPAAVVRHDPWLALVDARRRVREGALVAADEAFAHASSLLDEPTFRDRCAAERAAARLWLPSATRGSHERDPDHWSTPVRKSLRGVDVAPAPATFGPAARALSQGLVALLRGDLRIAAEVLQEARAAGSGDRAVASCTELASAVADLITGGDGDPATRLTEIARNAEVEGLPWIARLGHGLAECVLIAQGAPDWRVAASEALSEECDRLGDPWGAALLRLAVAVAKHVSGSGDPAPGYADAAARLEALEAPALQIWAVTLSGIRRAVSTGVPQVARTAADRADRAGVSGAAALASITHAVLTAGLAGAGSSVASVLDAMPAGRSASLRAAAIALLDSPDRPLSGPAHPHGADARECPAVPAATRRPSTAGATPHSTAGGDGLRRLGCRRTGAGCGRGRRHVTCFGGFRIAIGGRPLGLDELRPRARSLLAAAGRVRSGRGASRTPGRGVLAGCRSGGWDAPAAGRDLQHPSAAPGRRDRGRDHRPRRRRLPTEPAAGQHHRRLRIPERTAGRVVGSDPGRSRERRSPRVGEPWPCTAGTCSQRRAPPTT